MEKEQFAVYEKSPKHGKLENGIIIGPYFTKEEAEKAKIMYGYSGDNYYADKIK